MRQTKSDADTRASADPHCSHASDTRLRERFDPSAVASTLWSFNAEDISPLAWWRTLPPGSLRDAEHLLLRITLEKVEVLHQRGGTTARRGDAPAAIAFAMALLPIAQVTLKVDLAMSTVLLAALGGDAAAAVILARILRKVDLDHSSAIELADSWGRFSRRCSAIRPSHPVTANRLTSRGRGARAGTPSAGVFA